MKTFNTLILAAVVAWFGCSCSPSLHSRSGHKLQPIPAWADIIFAATWAGSTSEFGFAANELYAADSRGTRILRLTHNGYLYNHFSVSPDRKKIAAIRYSSGDTDGNGKIDFRDRKTLWILDLEAGKEWPLIPEYDAGWGGVVWSPDGEYIYLSIFKNFRSDIYRIHPDSSILYNVTKNIEKTLTPDLPAKWVSDTGISPDGQWLAFLYSGRKAGRAGLRESVKSRIAICRIDGSNPRFITDGGDIKPQAHGLWGPGDFDPEFSPDGRNICFQRATANGVNYASRIPSHDIMRIGINGSGLARLSPKGNTGIHGICSWSEDDRIIFSEWNHSEGYIGGVVVNSDGRGYHRLDGFPPRASHFRWIPFRK